MKEDTIIPFERSTLSRMTSSESVDKRQKAGFETAAGPDEPFFFGPQKFWLLGLSVYIFIFTIIVFAVGYILYAGILFLIMPIFCALLIFLPDIFAHHIHYRLQFTAWAVMSFVLIGHFIYALVWQKPGYDDACQKGAHPKDECDALFGTKYPAMYAWTWLCEPATILCTFICYRMYAATGASD